MSEILTPAEFTAIGRELSAHAGTHIDSLLRLCTSHVALIEKLAQSSALERASLAFRLAELRLRDAFLPFEQHIAVADAFLSAQEQWRKVADRVLLERGQEVAR